MAAETARVLNDFEDYMLGTAAPATEEYDEPSRHAETPSPQELLRRRERARAAAAAQGAPFVSVFAVFGSVIIAALMILSVLAQVSYNEVAGETVRLNNQLVKLEEQERKLEIAFESVVDMKEVEQYARDVLGMSKPDAQQVAIIQTVQTDTAEVIDNSEKAGVLRGFASFISSLTEYFKR